MSELSDEEVLTRLAKFRQYQQDGKHDEDAPQRPSPCVREGLLIHSSYVFEKWSVSNTVVSETVWTE